jgi:hypothetical protein
MELIVKILKIIRRKEYGIIKRNKDCIRKYEKEHNSYPIPLSTPIQNLFYFLFYFI